MALKTVLAHISVLVSLNCRKHKNTHAMLSDIALKHFKTGLMLSTL